MARPEVLVWEMTSSYRRGSNYA